MQARLPSDLRVHALTRGAAGVAVFSSLFFSCLVLGSCKREGELSARKAEEHVRFVADAVRTDVEAVRQGLPKGREHVKEYLAAGKFDDATAARDVLDRARSKVQDLRVAKSTFFALVDPTGNVLRSDQEHDAVAGKNLFTGFPELRSALGGKYVETRGALPELSGVRGRADGQWVAAVPVVDGPVRGLYVTGWSWSSYAYVLENQLRSKIRGGLAEREKEPLVYVYVVVGKDVFGAPISPEVNARAVAERGLSTAGTAELEITGRAFGLAYQPTPLLGQGVGVSVLRSET